MTGQPVYRCCYCRKWIDGPFIDHVGPHIVERYGSALDALAAYDAGEWPTGICGEARP